MLLLDTNVVSEFRKTASGRIDPNVAAWVASAAAMPMFISAVTLMELEIGVLAMERRDQRQGALLRAWLSNQVISEFEDRILAFDEAAALRCAALHVPNPRPDRDAMIAATALEHSLIVATRNVADFASMGVRFVDPWARSS